MKKHQQIRLKSNVASRFPADGTQLTRAQAIGRIRTSLHQGGCQPETHRLITLFSIHPEELAEAGVAYELIKALERRASFL